MLVIQSNATELSMAGDFCRLQQGKTSKADIKIEKVKSPLLGKNEENVRRQGDREHRSELF